MSFHTCNNTKWVILEINQTVICWGNWQNLCNWDGWRRFSCRAFAHRAFPRLPFSLLEITTSDFWGQNICIPELWHIGIFHMENIPRKCTYWTFYIEVICLWNFPRRLDRNFPRRTLPHHFKWRFPRRKFPFYLQDFPHHVSTSHFPRVHEFCLSEAMLSNINISKLTFLTSSASMV